MNCKKAKKLLLEFSEREPGNRKKISSHLNRCPQCRKELKAWEDLKQELKSDHLPSPAAGYWDRLASRTLSELAEKPRPLWGPAWRTGFVLAGILLLIINFYRFTGKPRKEPVQAGGDEIWDEVAYPGTFIRLAELDATELEELIGNLAASFKETTVEVSHDSVYPRNGYYESVQELTDEEIERLLEDRIFAQPLTGDNYYEWL